MSDTMPERLIERTEQNTEAISSWANHSLRSTEPDIPTDVTADIPTATEVHFFGSPALNGSAERQSNEMQAKLLDYKAAAEMIKAHNIPRSTIARLAQLHLPDLSAWLGGKVDISDEKRERVSAWITDVAKMIVAMGLLTIKVDTNDVENVRHLVQKINDAEMQYDLFHSLPLDPPTDLNDLRTRGAAAD